jgi:uncharacterized protein DUF2330
MVQGMLRSVLVATLAIGFLLSVAYADGGYIPERAFAKLPEIPSQRALLAWRDHVETLVVESTLVSESPSAAWILPLPAEPTRLEAGDPGTLLSLAICLHPKLTHDLGGELHALACLLAILAPVFVWMMWGIWGETRHRPGLGDVAALEGIVILLMSIFLPHLGGTPGSAGGGVRVIASEPVGVYDVSVIRAEEGAQVSDWLAGEGLRRLDANGLRILTDYIERGWCFVVARVRRESGGESTPHPLVVSFPAPEPVYPMKLTSLGGSTTHVELYVVADQRAEADGFRVAHSQKYERREPGGSTRYQYAPDDRYSSPVGSLGNPDVCRWMWDGCVVTRMEADLAPEAMDRDVSIGLTEAISYQDHYFTHRGRKHLCWLIGLSGGAIAVMVTGVVWRVRKRRRPGRLELGVLGGVVLATVLAMGGVWFTVPVTGVTAGRTDSGVDQRRRVWMWSIMRYSRDRESVAKAISEGVLRADMSEAELRGLPELLDDESRNPPLSWNYFTGEPARMRRCPGDFSVRTVGGVRYVCLYDDDGSEVRIPLGKAPEPESRPEP